MNRLRLFFVLLACGLCALSCVNSEMRQMQEQLRRHEEQIQQLKEFARTANTEMAALQTALQEMKTGGYVTSVVPAVEGGNTVGYTITFGSGESAYVSSVSYQAPQMGLEVAEDGNYYWTVDGEWLERSDGSKVQAGGFSPTPKLNPEDGHWFITLEDGTVFRVNEKATSASQLFKSVDTSNANYVLITLADGTILQLTTWSAHVALKNLVNQLNNNLYSLREIVSAQQDNDYLYSVTPFTEGGIQTGWVLNFAKSGSMVVYSPARENQEQGHKIKMENGSWWISEDGGKTFVNMDQTAIVMDNYITDVALNGSNFVTLTLSDGSTIDIPRFLSTGIDLEMFTNEMYITLDQELIITYNVSGTNADEAVVTAFSDGNFVTSVRPGDGLDGTLRIKCVRAFDSGTVTIMANDASGATAMKTVNLVYRNPDQPAIVPVPDPATSLKDAQIWLEAQTVDVSHEGGEVVVHAISMLGISYIWPNCSWAQVSNQKTGRGHFDVIFTAQPNPYRDDRYLTVYLYNLGSVRLHQAGNPDVEPNPYWEKDMIYLPAEGGSCTINIMSTAKDIHMTHPDWIKVSFGDAFVGDMQTATFSVEPYDGFDDREAKVSIDCRDARGFITITQFAPMR